MTPYGGPVNECGGLNKFDNSQSFLNLQKVKGYYKITDDEAEVFLTFTCVAQGGFTRALSWTYNTQAALYVSDTTQCQHMRPETSHMTQGHHMWLIEEFLVQTHISALTEHTGLAIGSKDFKYFPYFSACNHQYQYTSEITKYLWVGLHQIVWF